MNFEDLWEEFRRIALAARENIHSSAEDKKLDMSVRLLDSDTKEPISWGSAMPQNKNLIVVVHNPEKEDKVRIVCHVTDINEKRKEIEGEFVVDVKPLGSTVMLKFNTGNSTTHLHFMAAVLPLVTGRPLFHIKLSVNVIEDDCDVNMQPSLIE